ncbi:MAG TPA: excinuclease ABC subunit UvrC [Alphaproteobacteria bacterium]|nr:excinuclease ABC subunit UvrC [Alphaproteobacteria bacterium]HOO49995.1 excinuclease ABC subunit UvrC [Alphaproteobacteria bacterium]
MANKEESMTDCSPEPMDLPPLLAEGVAVIKSSIRGIGDSAGVYRMMSEDGEVLYVGKAKRISKRVLSYTRPLLLPVRLQRMIAQTRKMEFIKTKTESEALLLEANLIKSLRPKYNVLLKDDKSYPYILMTDRADYPQLMKFRGKPDRQGVYFGPFASAAAVNETLSLLQRVFMLRNCTDSYFASRKSPCLQYHIKRCTAPCVQKVSKEGYLGQVRDARDFLSGKSREVQERLTKSMIKASELQDYEVAAQLRDRVKVLTHVQSRQGVNAYSVGDCDVVAIAIRERSVCVQVFFYRGGQSYGNKSFFWTVEDMVSESEALGGFLVQFYQSRPVPKQVLVGVMPKEGALIEAAYGVQIRVVKRGDAYGLLELAERNAHDALLRHLAEKGSDRKILEGIADLFHLDGVPSRIEIYDNSHISGTNMIGAFVVASPDGFEKKAYRTFNIKMASASDDYAMMREVMLRRFGKIDPDDIDMQSKDWPNLLLIDGGAGQLSAVHDVLDELGLSDYLTVVGIAKGEKRNAGREKFFMRRQGGGQDMFQLPIHDPVLHYLQRLRDEAHRFAIGTHRNKRSKAALGSKLDQVPGIGAKRKKALLLHFGSAKAVEDASVEDLVTVEGISRTIAEKIYNFFHSV